jgi:hypothetical protein
MRAKVLVQVDRNSALEAIRTLDAMGSALLAHERELPKKLRRRYKDVRRDLVRALGFTAHSSGVADLALD